MEELLAQVGQFIKDNQIWAGPIIGIICFGESLVLVGIAIPATALMLVVGGLIGSGVLHPVPVLVGAVIGAILGDIVSYYLGRWLGIGVIYKWPLNRYHGAVARARLFFRRYSFMTVFFGRFIGPLRCTVPLVAGMMGMNQRKFQIANVSSALVWAPFVLAPGYLTAIGLEFFGLTGGGDMTVITLVVMAVSIVFALVIIRMMSKGSDERRRGRQARSSAG
jgi:membrane protein DedA with SNARE-associated domain